MRMDGNKRAWFHVTCKRSETTLQHISQTPCTIQRKTQYLMHSFYYLRENIQMFDKYKQIGECGAPGYNNISSQPPIRK